MLAKFIDGQIRFAGGKLLKHDGWITSNPREEDFISAGYKPLEDNRLEEKEGFLLKKLLVKLEVEEQL